MLCSQNLIVKGDRVSRWTPAASSQTLLTTTVFGDNAVLSWYEDCDCSQKTCPYIELSLLANTIPARLLWFVALCIPFTPRFPSCQVSLSQSIAASAKQLEGPATYLMHQSSVFSLDCIPINWAVIWRQLWCYITGSWPFERSLQPKIVAPGRSICCTTWYTLQDL